MAELGQLQRFDSGLANGRSWSRMPDVHALYRPAAHPGVTKGLGSLTTGEKAGPVSDRERDRLVEKEQFCPTAATHHRAATPPEFAETNEPGLARPAPLQQRSGCGIMDDPAVAGEPAYCAIATDVAKRCHAVLQRHRIASACRGNHARLRVDRQQPVETEQLLE